MTLLNFWHYSGLMLESKILSPSFSVFHLSQCQFLPKVVSPHGGKKAAEVPNCLTCLAHHPKGERAMVSAGLARRMRKILVQKTLRYHWSESIQVYF